MGESASRTPRSSWIDRELDRERQAAEQTRRHREAVVRFWPEAREQVRNDVDYFNSRCPQERHVDLFEASETSFSVGTAADPEHRFTLWLEPADGRILCRRGSGEAETIDLRLELNGSIEYTNLIGPDARLKLSQDLLKPVLFPGR